MRLAWDMTISAFGGRQKHYETFFFGDPVRMKQALYNVYDRSEYVARVNDVRGGHELAGVIAHALSSTKSNVAASSPVSSGAKSTIRLSRTPNTASS